VRSTWGAATRPRRRRVRVVASHLRRAVVAASSSPRPAWRRHSRPESVRCFGVNTPILLRRRRHCVFSFPVGRSCSPQVMAGGVLEMQPAGPRGFVSPAGATISWETRFASLHQEGRGFNIRLLDLRMRAVSEITLSGGTACLERPPAKLRACGLPGDDQGLSKDFMIICLLLRGRWQLPSSPLSRLGLPSVREGPAGVREGPAGVARRQNASCREANNAALRADEEEAGGPPRRFRCHQGTNRELEGLRLHLLSVAGPLYSPQISTKPRAR